MHRIVCRLHRQTAAAEMSRLDRIFSSSTSFQEIQWNLQASQSLSPHRSAGSSTPRDALNHLSPSLSARAASRRQPERKHEREAKRSEITMLPLVPEASDRQKSDFRSESVPLTTFPTQTQPHNNNKLCSTHQREERERTEGRPVYSRPTRGNFSKCHTS